MTATEADAAHYKILVVDALGNPMGSKVLKVEMAVGDLTLQEARDALRVGCEHLIAQSPLAAEIVKRKPMAREGR